MNVILVLIDSLNKSYLKAYNPAAPYQSPNLTAFAEKAWRFDNHFVSSLPCMPARREIFAGFKELMWRPWGPLEAWDERLPRRLEAQGYSTAIVTDHYHYWEDPAYGYLQSFQSTEMVRGHELDNWQPMLPDNAPVPQWVSNIDHYRGSRGRRYYANVHDFKGEEDFFPAKVFSGAARWLRAHDRQQPFFLQVESFDVHEPFHVPEPYASMYTDGDLNQYNVWPPYQNIDHLADFMQQTTPEELNFIRAQYAGKLTMVDRWFGELARTLDDLNLWDDTAVIITTDHGHDLGERGVFGKQYPHWDSHANIPLMVWHPEKPGSGATISGMTQTIDLFATIHEITGVAMPERTDSRSVLPLLNGGRGRDAIIYGFYGQGICCTDGAWTVFKSPEQDDLLNYYSSMIFTSLIAEEPTRAPTDQGFFIPGVEMPQWQVPTRYRVITRENFLFDRHNDPGQNENHWDSAPDQRQRMLGVMLDVMKTEGAPSEQYTRLGLPQP